MEELQHRLMCVDHATTVTMRTHYHSDGSVLSQYRNGPNGHTHKAHCSCGTAVTGPTKAKALRFFAQHVDHETQRAVPVSQ